MDVWIKKLAAMLGEKGQQILGLLHTSFSLLGREELRSLLTKRLIFSLICHGITLVAITTLVFKSHEGFGMFLLFVLVLVIYPYSFFYHVRMRARQTWFSYASITNHADPLTEAKRMVASQKWKLRLFAIVELALRHASNQDRKRRSIWQLLVASILALLEGIYKIAESYLMPTVVIDRLSLTDAAQKLRDITQHVPQTLAGVFGLDLLGSVTAGLLGLLFTVLLILGLGLGYILPQLDMVNPEYTVNIGNVSLFLYPVLIALVFSSFIRASLRILVSSLQASYFAVFYTRINHASELTPERQSQVERYLLAPQG
jgi:hypothetical protein